MKFYVFRKFYYLCTSIPAQSDIRRPGTYTGEMLEWLKRHAWKACIRQNRISGSNPDLSAPIGRSLLRPVLVSCLLKVYFHKGSRIQNHNVRRTSAYWSKGHPGEGRREEACAAWLIPISPQPTLKLKDLQNYHPALRPRMQSLVLLLIKPSAALGIIWQLTNQILKDCISSLSQVAIAPQSSLEIACDGCGIPNTGMESCLV